MWLRRDFMIIEQLPRITAVRKSPNFGRQFQRYQRDIFDMRESFDCITPLMHGSGRQYNDRDQTRRFWKLHRAGRSAGSFLKRLPHNSRQSALLWERSRSELRQFLVQENVQRRNPSVAHNDYVHSSVIGRFASRTREV